MTPLSSTSITTGSTNSVWTILIIALASGGAIQVGWQVFLYYRGGQRRKDRAEAAKSAMDIAADTEKAPLVRESIALGNFERALAIQQQVINGLNAQIKQDRENYEATLKVKDQEIADLRSGMKNRDIRIDELEREIDAIRSRLNGCQKIIEELRFNKATEEAAHEKSALVSGT